MTILVVTTIFEVFFATMLFFVRFLPDRPRRIGSRLRGPNTRPPHGALFTRWQLTKVRINKHLDHNLVSGQRPSVTIITFSSSLVNYAYTCVQYTYLFHGLHMHFGLSVVDKRELGVYQRVRLKAPRGARCCKFQIQQAPSD